VLEEGNSVGLEDDGSGESRDGSGDCCTTGDLAEGAASGYFSTDCTGKGCESSDDFAGPVELPATGGVGNELLRELVRVGGFDEVLDLNGTPVFQVNIIDVGIDDFVG